MDKDIIEYEIEISTKSSQNVRKLINDLNEADKKVRKFKSASGAPIQTDTQQKFGIFAGEMEDFAFPDTGRDKTSKQAVQTNNVVIRQLNTLQKKVKSLEELKEDERLNMAQNVGFSFLSGGGGKSIISALQKLTPVLGPLFIAWGVVDFWLDYMFKAGGPFDRRYKRNLITEVSKTTDRNLKGLLRQGYAEVRITSIPNLRNGRNLVQTNLNLVSKSQIQNQDLEMLGKGLI